MAVRHAFADRPAGIALDGDGRAVVEAAAIVADRSLEVDLGARRQPDAEIVPRQRVADDHLVAGGAGRLDFLVDLADMALADFDNDFAHAAMLRLPTPQIPVSAGRHN